MDSDYDRESNPGHLRHLSHTGILSIYSCFAVVIALSVKSVGLPHLNEILILYVNFFETAKILLRLYVALEYPNIIKYAGHNNVLLHCALQ